MVDRLTSDSTPRVETSESLANFFLQVSQILEPIWTSGCFSHIQLLTGLKALLLAVCPLILKGLQQVLLHLEWALALLDWDVAMTTWSKDFSCSTACTQLYTSFYMCISSHWQTADLIKQCCTTLNWFNLITKTVVLPKVGRQLHSSSMSRMHTSQQHVLCLLNNYLSLFASHLLLKYHTYT